MVKNCRAWKFPAVGWRVSECGAHQILPTRLTARGGDDPQVSSPQAPLCSMPGQAGKLIS